MTPSKLPTQLAFEQYYSDCSGVERAVRLVTTTDYLNTSVNSSIEIQEVDTVHVPVEQLDWLIDSLIKIQRAMTQGVL